MDSSDSSSSAAIIEYAILSVVILGVLLYKYVRRRNTAMAEDGPLLSSSEMLTTDLRSEMRNNLQAMGQGTMGQFKYHLMTNESGRAMLYVELGHDSGTHIVACGDKSDLPERINQSLHNKWLETAQLEGDFPKYFHMYCQPAAQLALREIFTPDVMADFEDFCRDYDFEVFDDMLYISQAETATDDGEAGGRTMLSSADALLKKQAATLQRL